MKYIKFFISTIVAMLVATLIIWFSLFVVIFSTLSLFISSWWKRSIFTKKAYNNCENSSETKSKGSYKIIEAEYKIINTTKG